jgi:FkbM family methyltransferase
LQRFTDNPVGSDVIAVIKSILPHSWRQAIKRRLIATRDMTTRLQVLQRAGFRCTGAVDAGAYRGEWSKEFWSVFPKTPILMVEPQLDPQPLLRELVKGVMGSEVLPAALSDKVGEVSFVLGESNSGIRSSVASDTTISVPCTTLAKVLSERLEFSPNLLKLDLQGHELKALIGAGKWLKQFEVIVCEMSVIPIGGVPAFAEMNQFFERRGYRLYDVLPQYDRPLDGALWQVDAFYVHCGSDLIASTAWN